MNKNNIKLSPITFNNSEEKLKNEKKINKNELVPILNKIKFDTSNNNYNKLSNFDELEIKNNFKKPIPPSTKKKNTRNFHYKVDNEKKNEEQYYTSISINRKDLKIIKKKSYNFDELISYINQVDDLYNFQINSYNQDKYFSYIN